MSYNRKKRKIDSIYDVKAIEKESKTVIAIATKTKKHLDTLLYKFKAHIHPSKNGQFYSTLVTRNGEVTYTSETRKRHYGVVKTINNLFPGVVIVDHTKQKKK